MEKSDYIDDKLDNLLLESKKAPINLIPLLARFAELAAASNLEFIEKYDLRIQEICQKWESEKEDIKGIRLLCEALANYYSAKFYSVLTPCEEALQILEKTPYTDLFGLAHMVYGGNHRSLGNLDIAVEYLHKGAELIDGNGVLGIYKSYCHYQLAEINVHINDYTTAEKNYNLVIEIVEKLQDNTGLFRAYNGMANLYLSLNDLEKCKYYLDLSLAIDELSDSQKSRSFCDLGIYYHAKEDYNEAAENLIYSYNLRIDSGLRDAASTSLINLGHTQIALNQIEKAQKTLEEGLSISLEYKSKSKMLKCYHLLAEVYEKLELWKKSTHAFKEYDKLQIELNSKQLQNIYTLKNNQIQKQKQTIEHIYEEVQDSIRYAKRIQSAILPSNKIVNENLKNNFILYNPKDIVAGDFYWLEQVEHLTLFAAADCTGHGVPGAMVSVVCNNALNRSVREFGLLDPGEILNKTREIVIQEFEKSEEEVKDGMDIALCSLEGNNLKYAGANNPLWIIRKGNVLEQISKQSSSYSLSYNETFNYTIIEVKANKQPIGNFLNPLPYLTHSINLEQGDTIYIFSDGFVDQFGGEKGKKLKAKALRKLLLGIQSESMQNQKLLLNEAFNNWKGNFEQVDDVCVIGVRI